jgi:hypothetical protein
MPQRNMISGSSAAARISSHPLTGEDPSHVTGGRGAH